MILSHSVTMRVSVHGLCRHPPTGSAVQASGVPAAVAVAYPQHWQRPDPPGVLPVVLQRDAGGQQVHDGAALAVIQARDRDRRAVQLGQLRDGRGQDAGGGRRLRLAAASQHALPLFRQVPGGRRGDAVAADTEPGAQPGELSGDRAVRRQRGDDVPGPVAGKCAQASVGGGRLSRVVLRQERHGGENPGGDDVQRELAWAARVPGHGDIRHRRRVLRAQVMRVAGSPAAVVRSSHRT
jgi:hypothetical protein